MCFNAELFIKWFIFITPSPSPPLPSLLSHIIHEEPWWIYFMHKTFRAGRDDHYLSHLEALPDKSFLEVDRPLKCSHWVREMNSSCVLLFQQLGKGDHGALEYKHTAGTKGTCSHEQQDYSSSIYMVSICWKKNSGSQKNLKVGWHHLVLLGFSATNTGPMGTPVQDKMVLVRVF